MKLLCGQVLSEPCVLTVGKFESIHRGHRMLINHVTQMSKENRLPSAVVAFTPHPYCVMGHEGYKPLFTQQERAFLLAQTGVDYFLEYPFDMALMQMTDVCFGEVLFRDLQAKAVVVGEEFQFGRNRDGNVHILHQLARHHGSVVRVVENCENISTSVIRSLLRRINKNPQLKEAAELLGFPYFAMGTVTRGRRLGHELGFPTLNLYPTTDKFLLRYGVYATRAFLRGQYYHGITNIGLRPTVDANEHVPTIETHLFDFTGDAYGEEIRVEFLWFMREEQKFSSLDELKKFISSDALHAKMLFMKKDNSHS